MRLFWKAAGADKSILEKVTYSDQVKYMCLGGIIVATGLMAAIAGGYAFYTIFEPKGSSLDKEVSVPVALVSMVFGVLWGTMIFNLDRFIVSSTGKGDGTEAITWSELKGALPRIFMGGIIAITISKPIEIRMFKSEIDVELRNSQLEKQNEYLGKIESTYAKRISNEKTKAEKWEKEIELKTQRYVELENMLAEEMDGERGAAGYGTEAKKIEEQMKKLDEDLKALKLRNDPLIKESYATIKRFESEKQHDGEQSKEAANGLDGLLARIKLAHEISGPIISLFITLLFMAIELTPIFFKLMLTKTPYDYLEENIKELMKAEEGILIEYDYYKDKKGQERDLIIFYAKDKLKEEKKARLKAQQELTQYAIQKYTDEMKQKIDANPSDFITSESINSDDVRG
ncbi:MAG: DUF4407 domain-containing protein [Bacteroidia bacterium]|nr:DUF4407 domain-containing protein [Bacteroidia bacterium]